jgi:hypothetical protein
MPELSLSAQVLDELASSVQQMRTDKVMVPSKRAVDGGTEREPEDHLWSPRRCWNSRSCPQHDP